MEFDTNKKILSAIIVGGVVAYFFISQESVTPEAATTNNQTNKTVAKKEKGVEILYLKSDKKASVKSEPVKQIKNSSHTVSIDEIYNNEEKIQHYIQEKGLVNITKQKEGQPAPRFQIYSDISKEEATRQRDKTLPPSAPAIITYTFHSGTQATSIIDSNVYNSSSELVGADTNPDGSVNEIVKIPTKQSLDTTVETQQEVKVVTPPQIGQNN